MIVATVRSLKMHGGADKKNLDRRTWARSSAGLPNLEKHIENVRHFGVPGVVALNRRPPTATPSWQIVADFATSARCAAGAHRGLGEGRRGRRSARRASCCRCSTRRAPSYRPLYPTDLPIKEKIDIIVRQIYGGDGADYSPEADRAIDVSRSRSGLANTPICMAKTQYSLTDDATRLGRPRGFRITVNEVRPSAGAGFVVAQCGDIMTMPGLPKEPAAERMARLPSGEIVGLF